jgi:hypothetical protein
MRWDLAAPCCRHGSLQARERRRDRLERNYLRGREVRQQQCRAPFMRSGVHYCARSMQCAMKFYLLHGVSLSVVTA